MFHQLFNLYISPILFSLDYLFILFVTGWQVTHKDIHFILFSQLVTGTKILIEGHSVQHLVVNVTAPPQMFCCQGCKGSCKVTITTHSNYERFYQRCSHNKYISEVMVGWAGTSQSPTPNMCGTSVTKTTHVSSWQQYITAATESF